MKLRSLVLGLTIPIFLVSFSMIAPVLTALVYQEGREVLWAFLWPMLGGMGGALLLFSLLLPLVRKQGAYFGLREGVCLVTVSWLLSTVIACLPMMRTAILPRFADAFFEAMSGFTTTGATVITDIESIPRAVVMWRSMTHWLGGMGMVMLSVAIAPFLGFGSFQLMRAEAPGLEVDRLTFRIAHTALIFWVFYLVLTVAQTTLLYLAGLDLFESIVHAFATLATGGFSSRNASIAAFNSPSVEWITTIFMMMAGTNFTIYFYILRGKWKLIGNNSECWSYLFLFLLATLSLTLVLFYNGEKLLDGLRLAAFQVASILTTTGFASTDYEQWPQRAQYVLFLLMFVGGCAGSTGGGIKVVRVVVALRKGLGDIRQTLNTRDWAPIQLNRQSLPAQTVDYVLSFIVLYLGLLLCTSLVVALLADVEVTTALSTALATLGNIGPGFGLVGPAENYAFYPETVKMWLALMMLVGRLELFTVLLLLLPRFWRSF